MIERAKGNSDNVQRSATANDSDPPNDRSIAQILQEILNRATEIIRSEIRLAKTEVQQDAMTYAKASSYYIWAGALSLYAGGFVLLGVVYALDITLPGWLAAIVVGVSVGIVAAVLFFTGRKKMRHLALRPDKTIETLKEDVAWIKKRTG